MKNLHTQAPVKELIEHFGGQVQTANALGVKQGTVSGWLNLSHGISEKKALLAEKVTNKKVRAIDLCPDLVEVME